MRTLFFILAVAALSAGCVSTKTHKARLWEVRAERAECEFRMDEADRRFKSIIRDLERDISALTARLRIFNQVDANGRLYPLREKPVDGTEEWLK